MKFHITLKDNETGDILLDLDTKAFVGGVHTPDGSQSIILANCNDLDLAKAIVSANLATKEIKERKGRLFELLLAMTEETTTPTEQSELGNKTED